MMWLLGCVLLVSLQSAVRADMVFRCPICSAERLAACPQLTETCAEIVREPGCGCCPVCACREGAPCGVYTPRCSSGFRCYPEPDSDLPLEQLVRGLGRCRRVVEKEDAGAQQRDEQSGELQDVFEVGQTETPPIRKNTKESWMGPKESAMRQHRQEQKSKMKFNKVEDNKVPRPKLTQCQQELDQVLERISRMPFRDDRGPLEDLYALHIPNCDKRGQYNPKQCKMSVNGQRGECWCVNPYSGWTLPESPLVRGDPNCSLYLSGQELEPPIVPVN
ncbi:insulin-like growth factor-binding protein 2-A [Denticeps clupeoides]|uniref:Insulin-like growth factor-binding protein 2-A n=1 Tax=Denticeps clupeoides TaxID=299321 RepID=A0AAY4B226_9TELE|nr:insulin-like growth factor-binding protein 2-A [Denticeps clupeoides]